MERKQIVSRDPEIMNGALVFAGTRVPVEILVQHLAAGPERVMRRPRARAGER